MAEDNAYFCFVVETNNLFLVKLLMQHGANTNAICFNMSTLSYAYETKNLELIELLLENGARLHNADLLERAEDRQDVIDLLLQYCDSKKINELFGNNQEKFKFWSEKLQNHRKRLKEGINHFTENVRTLSDVVADFTCSDNTDKSGF